MKFTLAHYQTAVENFAATIRSLSNHILSVFLYGSMARGDVIPGLSDLDFLVFLKTDVFTGKARFQQALTTMVEAGKQLKASGLPVIHAFCYYSQSEVAGLPAPTLAPNLKSSQTSQIILGRDIRAQIESAAAGRHLYQTSYFFELRRSVFHPLTPYLRQNSLTKQDCEIIVGTLRYIKYLPEAACAALNIWTEEPQAISRLAAAAPDIDIKVLEQVEPLWSQDIDSLDRKELQTILQKVLGFVEQVHDRLVADN